MGYFCALQNYMACLFYGFYNTASSGIFNIFLMTFLPDEKYSLYNHRQSHLIFYIFLKYNMWICKTCAIYQIPKQKTSRKLKTAILHNYIDIYLLYQFQHIELYDYSGIYNRLFVNPTISYIKFVY